MAAVPFCTDTIRMPHRLCVFSGGISVRAAGKGGESGKNRYNPFRIVQNLHVNAWRGASEAPLAAGDPPPVPLSPDLPSRPPPRSKKVILHFRSFPHAPPVPRGSSEEIHPCRSRDIRGPRGEAPGAQPDRTVHGTRIAPFPRKPGACRNPSLKGCAYEKNGPMQGARYPEDGGVLCSYVDRRRNTDPRP